MWGLKPRFDSPDANPSLAPADVTLNNNVTLVVVPSWGVFLYINLVRFSADIETRAPFQGGYLFDMNLGRFAVSGETCTLFQEPLFGCVVIGSHMNSYSS